MLRDSVRKKAYEVQRTAGLRVIIQNIFEDLCMLQKGDVELFVVEFLQRDDGWYQIIMNDFFVLRSLMMVFQYVSFVAC